MAYRIVKLNCAKQAFQEWLLFPFFRAVGGEENDFREALCIEKQNRSVREQHAPTTEEEREHDNQTSSENAS
jgi:hypothetical protein